jgi:hypothetical protein
MIFDILNDYYIFLQNNYNIGSVTVRDIKYSSKNFS